MSGGKIIEVSIPMEEGDPLGATPDDKMIIIQIQKDTLADGKLEVGDHILSVNSRPPADVKQFYHLLNVAARERGETVLRIRRDEAKAKELEIHNQIPANRGNFIKRREGYLYKVSPSISHHFSFSSRVWRTRKTGNWGSCSSRRRTA